MENKWTNEQLLAIKEKGSNILVAAAAGSGKTTVLVERIIRKIIDDKIDIDKILVVTFTNAAASEMRERILNALYKEIDKDPLNIRLRRQIVLLSKASICTIDSFCLDIVRNNFFEIGISGNFRIADNTELELLKQEAIEDTFEELYNINDESFYKLVELYTDYRDDNDLKTIILKIYNYIQSSPFPEKWLEEKVNLYKLENVTDFAETVWGKILLKNFRDEIQNSINVLKGCRKKLAEISELEKYKLIIEDDIAGLQEFLNPNETWDNLYEKSQNFKFKNWAKDSKITLQLKDEVKVIRDKIKTKVNDTIENVLISNTEETLNDMREMYPILEGITYVTIKFIEKLTEKKSEKNVMEFGDIEHYALKILLNDEVAKKYQERFEEIAIDEYQDSNLVQEYILTSISNNRNIFMVGDVKQSIYRFRQARPELFLEKYEKYGKQKNDFGQKIQLFKNFRSRKNILDVTNLIFQDIMSQEFGEIEYDEEEYLNLAALYEEPKNTEFPYAGKAEINIIDLKEKVDNNEIGEKEAEYVEIEEANDIDINKKKTYDEKEIKIEDGTEYNDDSDSRIFEKVEIEAKFVANRIQELIKSKYQVYDRRKGYRNIEYRDIVILLRATANVATYFEKELSNLEIPAFCDTTENYLDSIEVSTIISLLKIIDNPYRDIPLVAVMRSFIGDFTDNELLKIRLVKKDGYYYDAVNIAIESELIDVDLKEKIKNFLNNINKWREEERYLPLNELIWKIYSETDYYNYVGLMPNGEMRKANLKMLFERAEEYEKISFKGLFSFIRYIEKIKSSNNDLSAAKLIGENENVVRIMSIHKSKGLEFPVAIISRADKTFNQRDLNDTILLHQDIGFGPQYINYEKRVEYTTASKEAIKIKLKEESIAEEMRILYVALTRAKEKLIITGVENDFEKSNLEKKELLENYEKEKGKINHLLLKKYKSYLGWIELVYLSHEDISEFMELKVIPKNDILLNNEKKEQHKIEFDVIQNEKYEEVDKILNWKYENEEITQLQSKMTVTNIKELKSTEENNKEILEIRPKFTLEEGKVRGAERGTIIHLILQKIDWHKDYSKEDINEMIEKLCKNNIITQNQKNSISAENIYEIVNSNFMKKLKNAKEIYKEKPFYTYIKASEIYGIQNEENILVQGIIDLYYIDENDNIVLIDYKTDYVKQENELVDKYKIQLEIYVKALEDALQKKVKETYIYSTFLKKEIQIL